MQYPCEHCLIVSICKNDCDLVTSIKRSKYDIIQDIDNCLFCGHDLFEISTMKSRTEIQICNNCNEVINFSNCPKCKNALGVLNASVPTKECLIRCTKCNKMIRVTCYHIKSIFYSSLRFTKQNFVKDTIANMKQIKTYLLKEERDVF